MEPAPESPQPETKTAQKTPQPLGPSPAVREVLYRALALGFVIVAGFVILIVAAVSIGSGLLPALTAAPSPAPVPAPAPAAALSPTVSLPPTTAPVEFLPPGSEVTVSIEPKGMTGFVTINFVGGPGRAQIKEIQARLTGSDGTIVTGSMDPQTNSPQIILQGTRGTDQVEVFAQMYSGKMYKILDQKVFYPKRN